MRRKSSSTLALQPERGDCEEATGKLHVCVRDKRQAVHPDNGKLMSPGHLCDVICSGWTSVEAHLRGSVHLQLAPEWSNKTKDDGCVDTLGVCLGGLEGNSRF